MLAPVPGMEVSRQPRSDKARDMQLGLARGRELFDERKRLAKRRTHSDELGADLWTSEASHVSNSSAATAESPKGSLGTCLRKREGSTTEPTSTPRLYDTDTDDESVRTDPAEARSMLHAALTRRNPSAACLALRKRLLADPRGSPTVLAQCDLALRCLQQCEQCRSQLWAAFAAGQRSRLDALSRQAKQGLAAIPHMLARAWCPQTSADILGLIAQSMPCEMLRRLLLLVDDQPTFLLKGGATVQGTRPASCRPATTLDLLDHDLWDPICGTPKTVA